MSDIIFFFIQPYLEWLNPVELFGESFAWIFLMGFLVSAACALVGNLMLLRNMTLMGDAISHSLLPGVVIAFFLMQSRATLPMVIGALVAAMAASLLIEFIAKHSRIKKDAAIGIVFTCFFAFGVVLISLFGDRVDLDADCVLYGELGLTPFTEPVVLGNGFSVPLPVLRMAIILVLLMGVIAVFYKEWLCTAFDPALARSLGIPTSYFHYGFMILLSLVVVSAFESVGVILVMAMLVFPGATAALLVQGLPMRMVLSLVFAFTYALAGVQLSLWWNANIAGSMAVAAGALFLIVWLCSPKQGLIRSLAKIG